MNSLLLSPPVVFIIVLLGVMAFAAALSKLAFKPKTKNPDIGKCYACGEDVKSHLMQPDYSQFFPFAFFFTILHVVTLIVTTAVIVSSATFYLAILYLLGAVVSLLILYRK